LKLENLSLPITYKFEETIDDRFRKISIWVMHDNLNLNNSFFSMESIEDAKETLQNIPILAFVKKQDGTNKEDFAGHEIELNITDGEFKFTYLGRPVGIIPQDNNYRYEVIDNKTFVVVDGFIWTDYANEALDILERDEVKGNSMEIRVDNFSYDNVNKYTHINKYRYTGLTLLGDDINPAMVGSKAKLFSQVFDDNYFALVNELNEKLKQSFSQNQSSNDVDINNQEGGQDVEKFKKLFDKYSITKEQILEFDKDINFEEISVKDLEAKIIEFQKDEPETFSLTAMQLKDLLKAKLNENAPVDEWGYHINPYYYLDHNESFVWAEERENNFIPVQFDYSLDGEVVNIALDSKKICKWVLIPIEDGETGVAFSSERFEVNLAIKEKELEKQFTKEKETLILDYQTKLDEANENYSKLEETSKELKEFQANKLKEERELAETELFEKFSTQLSGEEINLIKENSTQFTLEQLEDKLFVLVGKKNANFSVKKDKNVKVTLTPEDKPKSNKPWANLMEK